LYISNTHANIIPFLKLLLLISPLVTDKYNSSEKQTSTLPSATINQISASAPIYYHDHIKVNKAVNLAITNLTNQLENLKHYHCYPTQEIKNQINVSGGNNQFINKHYFRSYLLSKILILHSFLTYKHSF